MTRYTDWIAANVTENGVGQCAELTTKMLAAFPELRRVRGHYVCASTGQWHPHWWLETEDGEVVDPTSSQFPSRGLGEYIEHEGEEPVGKCANCGGYIYSSSGYTNTVCSDSCARAYEAYCVYGI